MALFETVLVSDLKKPLQVKALTGNLFSADNNGNKITVSVMDNGTAAQISGNVTGYVIRADGKTVIVEGELVGNMASIVLPASAYTVIGGVSIVIKVGSTTVGACTSNVYRSTTDEIVDPGTVIPSITALMEQIAAAVEEVEDVVESIPPDYTELVEEVNNKVGMNHATQYTPSNDPLFNYGTWYHEVGTSYIARLNDSHAPVDPTAGSMWQVMGDAPYHIPSSSDSNWLVYDFADAVKHINDFQNNIADVFYSGVVYEEGHYVTRNGVTYKRKSWGSTTPVAKAWSASDWEKVEVANNLNAKIDSECSALKSAIEQSKADIINVTDETSEAVKVFDDGADSLPLSLVKQFLPIQSGEGDPSPTNIRPITGYDIAQIDIYKSKRNMSEYGNDIYYKIASGSAAKYKYRALAKVPVQKNEYYRIKLQRDVTSANSHIHFIGFSNAEITLLENYSVASTTTASDFKDLLEDTYDFKGLIQINNNNAKDYIVQAEAKYLYIMYMNLNTFYAAHDIYNFSVTLGNENISYADGACVKTEVAIPDAGQTFYGAKFTVNKDNTCKHSVNWKAVKIGDLEWTYDTTNQRFVAPITNLSHKITVARLIPLYCSAFKPIIDGRAMGDVPNNSAYLYTDGAEIENVYIKTTDYTTASELTTGFGDELIVYPVETPDEYTIPIDNIVTFFGINNVWIEGYEIDEITHPADTKLYVDKHIAQVTASQRLMELIVTANREDSMVATKAYSTGDLLIVNGKLYKVSTSIANGATLTVNTNVTETTVAAEIAALA